MKKNNRSGKGFFLGLLFSVCNYISGVFRSGWLYSFFSSHEKARESYNSSATALLFKSVNAKTKRFADAVKKFVARQFERSFMLKILTSAISGMISLPGRVIGAFGMTWGIYSALIFLIKKYALFSAVVSSTDLLVGVIVFFSSLPLLFTEKSLLRLANESALISSVLSKVFGVPSESLRSSSYRKVGQSGAVILGIIIGLATYFIPPLDMIYSAASIAIIALIFSFPEGGVLISIFIAPFLGLVESPSILLAFSVILTAISYFIKVIRGKRVFKVGLTGFTVYAFMIAVFFSGIAPGESNTMQNALLCCSLMMIFPLVVNLMKYRHWINACIVSFTVPSGIVAFIGVAQHLLGLAPDGWIDNSLFSAIESRTVSVFNNPNILGAYLAALFPLSLMLTVSKYNAKIRVLGGIASCYIVVCTILTYSRSAWLALVAGAIIFAVLVSPRGVLWLIPASLSVALLGLVFPDTIGARLLNFVTVSDSANNYRLAVWDSSWNLLSDSFLFGIGWGEEAFKTAYINYGVDGTQYAMHSHSLYLQVAIQCGLIGLILFLLAVLVVVRKCISFDNGLHVHKKLSLASRAAIAGAFAIMIAGIFDYTWYNFRVFFVFWALLAFASAAVNVSSYENEFVQYAENDECSSFVTVPIPRLNNVSSDNETNKED